ncbi:MAG: sirohydrochlorin cobaltochelatase [Treponema sp.]|nr:sirohydrochlorin cobaltochelatase [Treponema sp.]
MKKIIYADYELINSEGETSLENKLESLLASDVDEILIKPILMTDGYEAKKLRKKVEPYIKKFSVLTFGTPVLGSPNAIRKFSKLLIKEIGFSSEYEYCLVGHGRADNREYSLLSDILHSNGFFNVEVVCLTGEGNIDLYLKTIKEKSLNNGIKRVIQVFPLFINIGFHIKQDIFGIEETGKKSFVQNLEAEKFTVIKNPVPLSHLKTFKDWYLDERKNQFS